MECKQKKDRAELQTGKAELCLAPGPASDWQMSLSESLSHFSSQSTYNWNFAIYLVFTKPLDNK